MLLLEGSEKAVNFWQIILSSFSVFLFVARPIMSQIF